MGPVMLVPSTAALTTTRAGAEHLGICERHFVNLLKKHNLPVIRLGRSVRVPVAVVERLAREGVPSGSVSVG